MELELTNVFKSPVGEKDQAIWVSEKEAAFFMTDRWKICQLSMTDTLSTNDIFVSTDKESAYSMKGIYDKRLPDWLFEEIAEQGLKGFRLLGKPEYDSIDTNAGSNSYLEIANRFGIIDQYLPLLAKNGSIILFGKKLISIGEIRGNSLHIADTVKTRSKAPIDAYLHPRLNLIIYAVNYGEVYGQYFEGQSFTKCFKIDSLLKPCFQVGFKENNNQLITCGLGFIKIYDCQESKYVENSTVSVAARSFEITGDYLILNKGIHGIDLFLIKDKPEKVGSLKVPFVVDRMVVCKSSRQLLLTSNPSGKIGLANIFD